MSKKLKLFIFVFLFLTFSGQVYAEDIICTQADKQIFETYVEEFSQEVNKPLNELIISTAKYFLGRPYVASTLELHDEEQLTINLREFDCTTFVENCIVLSEVIKSGDHSYNNYLQTLQLMRYRNGLIDGYTSRLHYTSDWIFENEKRGVLKNISKQIGGEGVRKDINFMTLKPQLYKHLKDNPQNVNKLKRIEKNIRERNVYEILPLDKINQNQDKIKNGDIVVFATSVNGLDYSHIGIAYWQEKELHFIHASSKYKKVVIEDKTLLNYCKDSKSCTGISVLRVINKE
ncbi:DUF1460 domain-containing protein [Dysgonomonas sp. Marseille-P4677]|uniref:N-acetylmuramoyl-L-alanine amidase-like domain-containing protein n=1 Tax=Dysgonomonas sp. Marseille-P4677 TaxID=2364790 RepID=UPI001911DC05|nr:N-acetylmuramoyl-L-alanine amidase-like domain-containing protein [Dysgonomonas sp. Marseille-P4677]MBK5720842.1 DUF1460 domain-containing protein [Dysgonomonas sp. Marseille-P4677]